MPDGNGRFWGKIGIAMIPLVVAGLVGFGSLKNEAQRTREELATKANKETVNAQYEALLREVQGLRADIQALRGRP